MIRDTIAAIADSPFASGALMLFIIIVISIVMDGLVGIVRSVKAK